MRNRLPRGPRNGRPLRSMPDTGAGGRALLRRPARVLSDLPIPSEGQALYWTGPPALDEACRHLRQSGAVGERGSSPAQKTRTLPIVRERLGAVGRPVLGLAADPDRSDSGAPGTPTPYVTSGRVRASRAMDGEGGARQVLNDRDLTGPEPLVKWSTRAMRAGFKRRAGLGRRYFSAVRFRRPSSPVIFRHRLRLARADGEKSPRWPSAADVRIRHSGGRLAALRRLRPRPRPHRPRRPPRSRRGRQPGAGSC